MPDHEVLPLMCRFLFEALNKACGIAFSQRREDATPLVRI